MGRQPHVQSRGDPELQTQPCGIAQEGGEEAKTEEPPDKKGNGADTPLRCPQQGHHLLAYFTRGEKEDEDPNDKAYAKIKFGPERTALALIDSGNMVASAINEQLVHQLGLPLHPYDGSDGPAAVAPDGRRLEIVGQTSPIHFTFDGAPNTTFAETLIVIKNLSHQMNLGKAWLSRNKAVHDHGSDSVRLKRPEQKGWTTVRLRGLQEVRTETPQRFVYGQMRTRLPAKSARYVPVSIPSVQNDADVVIVPVEGTHNPVLLAKSVSRVKAGKTMAAIFNPLEKAVYIEKWIKLGVAEDLEPNKVMGTMSSQKETPQPATRSITAEEERRRRAWLREEFRLYDSDVLQGDSRTMRQLEDLLLEYWDTISQHKTDYGKTDMLEMNIDLVPGATPYKGRCLPTNPAEEADLLQTLEDWNRQGITEPANSPWGAPLIPVRKKDGRLRWCVDFRKLNEMTVKDSYPLPLITSNLQKLGASSIFSTIDGTGAYHNVVISERDRPLTAFVSPFGQFQFLRMPFGLCNAPQVYSRLVQLLLQGTDVRHILAYIDDIIAHTSTKEDHLRILRQILDAHRRGGLKIAPAKSFLFRSKVDYLGHQVSADGIEMVPSYTDLLLNWPKPTTPKELATFLGKAGYYRSFVKDYGKIVACLEAEKKKPKLVWTPQMDKAFEVVKTAFSTRPVLAYPDFSGVQQGRPFILDSDWSQEGMAQQISQVQPGPDGLRERVIANKGRKCTQAERNYSSNKGETASFVDGLEAFEHLLRYAPFKARVDNRCLSYIRNLKKPTGIWWRWLEFIQSFNFDIAHRAGKKHGNVDALSRAPHLPEATEEQERRSASYFCALTKDQLEHIDALNVATLNAMEEEEEMTRDVNLPLTNQQIRQAQADDPTVRNMMNWVRRGVKPTKEERRLESLEVQQMVQDFEMFYIHNNILYRRILENEPKVGDQERLVLPRSLREMAFYHSHAHKYAGHMGMKVTQNRMRSRFYFVGLYNWVEKMVIGCHKCIKKSTPTRANMPPKNIQRGYPGARWSLDLVGPLPESDTGNVYIMTAEENFCRWPIAVGIPDRTAETVARAFEQHVVSEHGSCQQLLTDNAQELTGNIIADVAKILGINKVTTVPYNPNGNKVERWHSTLGKMLRTVVAKDQRDWDTCLPACLLAYRTSVHRTTKHTPYYLMHGRECILPIDLIFARPPQDYEMTTDFGKEMTERLDAAFKFVRENQKKVIRRQVALAEGNSKDIALKAGDLVWYYSPRQTIGQSKKLHQGWRGPFQIQNAVSEVMYIITPHGEWTDKRPLIPAVIHRLKKYHPDTAEVSPRTEATEEELVKELIDTVDENLEATDEVEIEVCPEQQHQEVIRVQIPDVDEMEEIEDIVTRRNKKGGGRAATRLTVPIATDQSHDHMMENLDKDLKEFFDINSKADEKMEHEDEAKEGDVAVESGLGVKRAAAEGNVTDTSVSGGVIQDNVSGRSTSVDNVTGNKVTRGDSRGGNVTKLVRHYEATSAKQEEGKDQSPNAPKSGTQSRDQVKEQRPPPRRSQRHVARSGPFTHSQPVGNVETRTTYKTASGNVSDTVGPAGPTPVPSYMAAAAQGAAVTPEGSAKRAREEDTESVTSQKSAKQFEFEWARGFNSIAKMTEAMAHCHISIHARPADSSVPEEEDEVRPTHRRRHRSPPRRMLEIPHNRIVLARGGQMPVRGSINAAGYDCFAVKEVRIAKGQTGEVSLGFQLAPTGGVYCRLAETSTWAQQKPMFLLRAGVIDPDFRGQVSALITYLGPNEFGYINKGERVCQLIPTCFRCDPFHVCTTLPKSGRGNSAGYARAMERAAAMPNRERPEGGRALPDFMEADWVPMAADQRSLGAESSKSPSPEITETARMGADDRDTPPPVSGPPMAEDSCTN